MSLTLWYHFSKFSIPLQSSPSTSANFGLSPSTLELDSKIFCVQGCLLEDALSALSVLLFLLFYTLFHLIYNSFPQCADIIIVYHYVLHYIINPESDLALSSCLHRTLGKVFSIFTQYTQLLTSDSSCLSSHSIRSLLR